MPTYSAAVLRTKVRHRLKDQDSEQFTDFEIDEGIADALVAAFPALYKIVVESLTPNASGKVTPAADTGSVYAVWDNTDTTGLVSGWWRRGTDIWGLVDDFGNAYPALDFYSIGPVTYTAAAGATFPAEWLPTVAVGAAALALEAKAADLTSFRGYEPNSELNVDENEILSTISLLRQRFETERDERAMALPSVRIV